MLVGIQVEGNDHLILTALLARLLGVDETQLEVDRLDHPGMGWKQVLEVVPKALKRFYGKCAALAVIGVDNDGDVDLADASAEDRAHPRHWLHAPSRVVACRQCQLEELVALARPQLDWITNKPGALWPVLVCVPVEAIESWIAIVQAILTPGRGSLRAEQERRSGQKLRLYGRPAATRADVDKVAVPAIRALSPDQLQRLRSHSRSFDAFAAQVDAVDRTVLARPCWS